MCRKNRILSKQFLGKQAPRSSVCGVADFEKAQDGVLDLLADLYGPDGQIPGVAAMLVGVNFRSVCSSYSAVWRMRKIVPIQIAFVCVAAYSINLLELS
jgi:hypothetical protein